MSDIAAFIRARLDEREAAAKAVEPLGHVSDMGGRRLDEEFAHARRRYASEDGRSSLEPDAAAARHFALHDPVHELREVEAHRAIVELHDGPHECSAYDHNGDIDNCTWIDDGRTCSTLRLIAAIDSDHPDYDKSWSPVTC